MKPSHGVKLVATLHLPSAYYICFSEEDSAAHATLVYHQKSQEPCLPAVTLADKHFYTNVSAVSLNNCRIFPNHNRPFIKIHLLISLIIHLPPEGTAANTVLRDTWWIYILCWCWEVWLGCLLLCAWVKPAKYLKFLQLSRAAWSCNFTWHGHWDLIRWNSEAHSVGVSKSCLFITIYSFNQTYSGKLLHMDTLCVSE